MGEILGVIILTLLGGLALAALLTVLLHLLPQQVQKTRTILESSPKRAFVVGLVNFIFFGLLATFGAERRELLQLIAVLIVLTLLGLSAVGLTAVTHLLRQRMYDSRTVNDTFKTAVLLIAAGLSPVVGWFVLTPLTLLTSLGAVIISLFRSPQPSTKSNDMETLPY